MFTFIFGTLILALAYGAFWHNQPARGQDRQESKRNNRRKNERISFNP